MKSYGQLANCEQQKLSFYKHFSALIVVVVVGVAVLLHVVCRSQGWEILSSTSIDMTLCVSLKIVSRTSICHS